MSVAPQAQPTPGDQPQRTRRRFGISIQSTLLFVMLAVSLTASVAVGVVTYQSGRGALQASALEQLTTIRELRTAELERYFATIQNDVSIDSASLMVMEASTAFNCAFAKLSGATMEQADLEAACGEGAKFDADKLLPEQTDHLAAYYRDSVLPELQDFTGEKYADTALIPRSWAGRYLQYHYTSQFTDWEEALQAGDAGDGSDWSSVRERYHDHFARLIEAEAYEDFLLLDTSGNVVYSAYSGIDLGATVRSGPYAATKLAEGYEEVLQTGSTNTVVVTDAEFYVPSMGRIIMWVMSPVGNDGDVTGVLAAEIAMYAVGDVMTGNQSWESQGLGDTGEVYLVGPDLKMRTISRLYAEYPEEYIAQVREAGTSPAEIAEIERTSSTVLTQSVDTTSVALALKGDRGTVTNAKEYTGKTSITAFRPLDLGKLDWVVIARIDSDEAFGPATDFALRIILTLLVIVLVVCLVSLAFAQYFTRPVRRLADAARAVTNGDVAMRLPNLGSGEVGELGQAFNELSEALAQKQQQVYEQQAENTRMLTAVMPESMARRFHAGEDQIGDDYPDVAVVSTEVLGLEQLAAGRTGPEEIALLRQLAKGFDDAAERMGIERMRSLRGRYMACSGLVTPRVDSVDRAVDFAVEMKAVVERFNTRAETSLTVKIGVSNGLVRAGLIDRRTLAYDLWGEAVDTANAVRWVSPDPGIYLTKAVYDHVRAYHKLVKAGSVETPYGTKDVWRIG